MAEKEHGNTGEETATNDAQNLDSLLAQLEEAQREVEQFRNLLQRVQADSVNYKRRTEEQKEELQNRANANLIIRLLPALDDFERALYHIPEGNAIGYWIDGIELVHRNLKSVLESFGVTQIEAINRIFDPLEHESIHYEISEDYDEGTVISVMREGYKLHGWVLRPAQVTVAKRKEEKIHEENISSSSEKESE